MTLAHNLREMESHREAYWLRYPSSSPFKLRWRAVTVRHCFHVLPGESILELGAGSGLWTEHLSSVLRGENPITAAVFNPDLAEQVAEKSIGNVTVVHVDDPSADLPAESFDYVVGTGILCHDQYDQNLAWIRRLLKPGGQMLFFEANHLNPQVALKDWFRPLGRWSGNASCQLGLRRYDLMKIASNAGFSHIDVIPFDIIHGRTPRSLIPFLESKAVLFEHMPFVRQFCGTLYVWAKRPGSEDQPRRVPSLANHDSLVGKVSVVIPCHNEEMNIPRLADALRSMYDRYIHEIVIVNDNSQDRTAEVTRELAKSDPRIKLVNRTPPGGVGHALRDGYAAASGDFILSMDCDFAQIVPELRDMFDAIAEGYEGAIGSRFSHDSVLLNYPFFKIVCNRGFHALVKLLLLPRARDLSNNLKLYRADILKNLVIEEAHFAANAETGLKPILAGYRIKEVPISWINRTSDMGRSSFRILKVAPNYLMALLRTLGRAWRGRVGLRQSDSSVAPSAPV
ncbi:MAG: bifunctional class I SAM-dependent methyltransferase/glycosyltransferase family 2 protein [Acidobacteria bacterium]|nr:bifunctional class I SAM-dependent methyltransferase/glycosyltransferase family 2 protein [Acidobacteriota bacterium]